jgi:hypothetical protein
MKARATDALVTGLVATVASSMAFVAPAVGAPSGHGSPHAAQGAKPRPKNGKWKLVKLAKSVSGGSFVVSGGGSKVKKFNVDIPKGNTLCTAGKYAVHGSFAVRKTHVGSSPWGVSSKGGGTVPVTFHVSGKKLTGSFGIAFTGATKGQADIVVNEANGDACQLPNFDVKR